MVATTLRGSRIHRVTGTGGTNVPPGAFSRQGIKPRAAAHTGPGGRVSAPATPGRESLIQPLTVTPVQRLYLPMLPQPTVQVLMTHFGWLDLHARSVPARLSGGEERMSFRLLVQRFRRQVDAARPDDRPGLRINRDLSEVGGVIQWREDARPPFTGEIDIPGSAVAEQQAQHVVTDHGGTHHGWQVALIHDLHVTPAGRCRAGAHSAVPVPSSPGSHRA